MKNKYGLQLYSVRDITEKDLEGAIRAVAELGYSSVEMAGFFGHSAKEVRKMLDGAGVTLVGTHSSDIELSEEKIEDTIAYHKAIGNKNYIIPAVDFSTPEKIEAFVALVNSAGPRLAEAGITLAYHNHSAEYLTPTPEGCFLDTLEKRTNNSFEIDTYWAWNAGRSPVEEMKRLGKRLILIHLKDGLKGGEGRALGEGEVPLGEIIAAAEALGVPMVVESETLDPTGPEEVKRCIEYLQKNG